MRSINPPIETIARPSALTILEFLKPVTWFPPMWAFGCGVISAGIPLSGQMPMILLGILLAGPLVCACSQAVNDWYDRDVDAINQPERPIPSGRLPGRWGWYVALAWTGLSLLVASTLGMIGLIAGIFGLVLAWMYSAPPWRFKNNGWIGNLVVGVCYEGLPWITGAAVVSYGAVPALPVWIMAALYSLGAHGIMTLNDFKSITGDKATGVASVPVQLGVNGGATAACLFMLIPQLLVVAVLLFLQAPLSALAVSILILGQLELMRRFRKDPVARATWFSAWGVQLYVLGMLISAFAIRSPVMP